MHLHRGRVATPTPLVGGVVRLEPSAARHDSGLVAAATEATDLPVWSFVARDAPGFAAHREQLTEQGDLLYTVILNDGDRVVGETAFYDLEWIQGRAEPDVGEIGYTWYAPSVRRTAVNTEAKRLLLAQGFDGWGMQRIALRTDARNLASRNAMQRLGLVFEGVRRRHRLGIAGDIRDSAYFSLVAEEWPAVRDRLDAILS